MIQKHFEDMVSACLGFSFSPTQKQAMSSFAEFFFKREEENLFLLKGYAGTGKTSLVAAIVNALVKLEYKVVLLAPTGRAAKVFSAYAGQPAFTIHKKIYRQKAVTEGEGDFNLGFNTGHDVLFFVDEASMISNITEESNFGSGHLLDDLVEYVYNGRNNRLILIGDMAQLPPVGLEISPALDPENLRFLYNLNIYEANLTDVMRQAEKSGILFNATQIRMQIGIGTTDLKLQIGQFPDVYKIDGGELLEEIETCYGKFGVDETMIVCRSNKRANRYNEGIRRMILYREEDFCSGDKIMVVKNNYFWCKDYEHLDFIANGDVATVIRTGKRTELYGFHFIRADLSLMGYEEEVSAWVMLDTLFSDYPALGYEETKTLYRNVEADYADIPSRKKRYEKVRENEYYNALQVKFGYAVTCHKAQGGQWDAVFIDQGWLPDEMLNDEYWRWLYTAVTRARKRIYFVGFREKFFGGE
ncbi:ATP-dependent DNA helicase [Odoribacter lunatus]|uniref:ATP-dependent DNA helicase n=1 Tax=Odoribacter lunatus TaxID=2941335 RepID=UPI00203AB1A9|nr:AAA family ATPase [Odoribacter lunatus]